MRLFFFSHKVPSRRVLKQETGEDIDTATADSMIDGEIARQASARRMNLLWLIPIASCAIFGAWAAMRELGVL